jgi:glycosyltransferase involved in cell wall biosynthesis/ADP-heptose:LPS heptosyltransferase
MKIIREKMPDSKTRQKKSRRRNAANGYPIHFFTIVLNGEPFIRHHIEVFRKLPFQWHWHIIEGVADLKHDTSWSLQFGAHITGDIHKNGLSNDGTTEYLDELAAQFPENVAIYRKGNGVFWDGKLEMVNAPLINIREECLLYQVDADELWTVEQLCACHSMFMQRSEKTAAYYYSHYFVGENLVITTRDTYGNYSSYEWLRTWRYKPGDRWTAHEPPRLFRQLENNQWVDIGKMDPFMHSETEQRGLVFQHYAYATETQVYFKERYFGYKDAVKQWKQLQEQTAFPVFLKDYFNWVKDNAQVNSAFSHGVHPIARKILQGQWRFEPHELPAAEPRNILWVRIDSIGDTILSASMLSYIKEKYRDAKITVVCQRHIAELYEACPYIDKIITIPTEHVEHKWDSSEEYRAALRQIGQTEPDILLNSVYSVHGLADIPDMEFIPERRAFRNTATAQYTHLIPTASHWKPEMERHRDFLRGLGIDPPPLQPKIWTDPDDEEFADKFFKKAGLDPARCIAVCAGSRTVVRYYEPENYAQILNEITASRDLDVVLLGGEGDKEINGQISPRLQCRVTDLSGRTTLRQTAALIRRMKIYLGSETSAAHIACAVGVPNVVLLGGGYFGRFMPYSPLTSVVCLPLECYGCFWQCRYQRIHCVRDISKEVIVKAVKQTLAESSEKPRVFVHSRSLWTPDAAQPRWQWFDRFLNASSVEIIPFGDTPASGTEKQERLIGEHITEEMRKVALLMDNGNFEDAVTHLEQAIDNYPESPDLLNFYAVIKFHSGEIQEAEERFKSIVQRWPMFIKAYNNLGEIYWARQKTESAADYYIRALTIDPYDKLIVSNYGQILRATGEKEAAKNLYVSFLSKFPRDEEINEALSGLDEKTETQTPQQPLQSVVTPKEGASDEIAVSIIVATKNRARMLDEMLVSLKKAAEGVRYEIIVIEGGSSDNTLEILQKHGVEQMYDETEHMGEGRHSWPQLYNFGFSKAKGRWAMYASDDITFNERCIFRAVALLNRQDPGLVAGGVFFYKNVVADPEWDEYGIDFNIGEKLLLNYGLVRRECFSEAGGFDAGYRFYCADSDFCLKLYEKGKQLIPLPWCFVTHNNVLDVQKKTNLETVDHDMQLRYDRWRHFVAVDTPPPRRLFWKESMLDGLSLSSDLPALCKGMEHFWRGLAYFQYGSFKEAADKFALSAKMSCRHWIIFWYLARAFLKAGNIPQAERTLREVISLAPHMGPAKKLLQKIIENRPPQAAGFISTGHDPKVSIFIPAYNAEKYLAETLDSLLAQTFQDFEIIIADDGSTDKTPDIATMYEGRDKRIKVLTLPHGGEVAARNEAVRYTNSGSIYLLNHDSDDISLPDKLEKLVAYLDAHPETAIVGCFAKYFDDEGNDKGRPAIEWRPERIRETFGEVNSMINSAALIRRTVIEKIGTYREEYRRADDYDFFARALIAGFRLANIPEVLHNIRLHPQSIGSTKTQIVEKLARKVRSNYKKHIASHKNSPKAGSADKTMRLHLGCGNIKVPGFINVDIDPTLPAVDVVDDIRELNHFNKNSASLIYACHVLEHFANDKVLPVLRRWHEVLEPGGELRISVPDIDRIVTIYYKNWKHFQTPPNTPWIGLLYGGQGDRYDFHKTGFNFTYLKYLLQQAGFTEIEEYPHSPHWLGIHDASLANEPFKEYISLNVKAKKPGGLSPKSNTQGKCLSILHTVEFYHPHVGGAESVIQQISERLARRGHHVEVATAKLPDRIVNELNGVMIHEFDIAGNLVSGINGNDIQRYQEFLLRHPSDVMMNYAAQQWATDLAFNILDEIKDKRVNVIAPCGYSALRDPQTLRWPQYETYFSQTIPLTIPLYDAAIYHSALYKDYEFGRLHGFKNSTVIPNGVDEEEFLREPETDFRAKYNITTPYIGLCVANFYSSKGHDRILHALRQMKRNDLTMVFIGKDGDQVALLKAQAADLKVRFLINIPREDTVAAFHAADIFLFGSYIEASPLVIIEAKASGTPFVSTDCGNVREWKGGIVCGPEEIAKNANRILDDEAFRRQLAEEGFREWKEKLTWEAVVDQYEDLYLRLHSAKKGNTPRPVSSPAKNLENEEQQLMELLQKDFRNVSALIRLAEIALSRLDRKKARHYLIAAMALEPDNRKVKTLWPQVHG